MALAALVAALFLPVVAVDLAADGRTGPSAGAAALRVAQAVRRTDDLDAAGRLLTAAERAGADPRAVAFERALLLAQAGQPAVAQPALASYLAAGPNAAELVWEALGRGHLRRYELHEARACFDALLRLRPDSLAGLVGRAETYRQWAYLPWGPVPAAGAVPDLRRAVALAPTNPTLRLLLAEGLMGGGDPAAAEAHLRAAATFRPWDPEAPTRLAIQCLQTDREEEARRLLERVVARHPRHAPALAQLALLADRDGDEARASELFARAVAADPYDRSALYGSGNRRDYAAWTRAQQSVLYRRFAEIREAERELDEVRARMLGNLLTADPGAPELRVRAARAAQRLGRPAEARLWLERAAWARSACGEPRAEPGARPERE